jgi:integrase
MNKGNSWHFTKELESVPSRRTSEGQRRPWNKGVKAGQRHPFSRSDVGRIKKLLAKRGDPGLRDLALFSISIDTMLRLPDLLGLTVKDVRKRNRVMRDTLDLTTADKGRRIQCTLSKATMNVLDRWINQSGKKPGDYLFAGQTGGRSKAITARQVSRLVKFWATEIGLDASLYGTESLRRTRSKYILNRTGNLEAVRVLLGHDDIGSTARYLGDTEPQDALAISRAHEM